MKKNENSNREQRTENIEQRNYSHSIFLGNIYGLHDGYDGSVFSINGLCKTITASIGGIACILVECNG